MPTCPRCGRTQRVEELGTTAGSVWLHCGTCGHVWRRPAPGLDAFALILAVEGVVAPPEESTPRIGVPRATRFSVRLVLRYRDAGGGPWHSGLTENISRSGILFRTRTPLEPGTPVELVLVLPGHVAGEPESRIRCEGRIVRTELPSAPELTPGVAARVHQYELAR
jgi:hypothetical protein